ncbi:MAG: DUF2384 domain-containing protein [Nibricoccus sp.]
MGISTATLTEVCYAAHAPLSSVWRRSLEKKWLVKEVPVSDVVQADVKTFPEFLWLNLGRVKETGPPISLVRSVAEKQAKTRQNSFVFISGFTPKGQHAQLAEAIYEQFPNPLLVQIDLAGEPDVVSALEKFRALKLRGAREVAGGKRLAPIIEIPNADLRSGTGRLSAAKIGDVFGVTMVELGRWIGSKKAALSKTPDAASIQDALKDLARIALFRKALGGAPAFRQWLRTENREMENKSPLEWIELGRTREVADFVEDALSGHPK